MEHSKVIELMASDRWDIRVDSAWSGDPEQGPAVVLKRFNRSSEIGIGSDELEQLQEDLQADSYQISFFSDRDTGRMEIEVAFFSDGILDPEIQEEINDG